MMTINNLIYREVEWQPPIPPEAVTEMLLHLACLSPRSFVVWEVRCVNGEIRFLLGCDSRYLHRIEGVFKAHGNVNFTESADRPPVRTVCRLRLSHPSMSLNTDTTSAMLRAVYAALRGSKKDEEVVIQIILGPSHSPELTPALDSPDQFTDWLSVITGKAARSSPETKKSVRTKAQEHRFDCVIRIGTTANNGYRINAVVSALRILESAGVRLTTSPDNPVSLNETYLPWRLTPELSVLELSGLLLLPAGVEQGLSRTCGLEGCRNLFPPFWYAKALTANPDCRQFAAANNRSQSPFVITSKDSLEHCILLGPTGAGKSTVLLNMILSDIHAGRSVLVIDPKADLVNDVLARIPDSRRDDVVVLDPSSSAPVGFNPLSFRGFRDKTLLADAILAAFREIFSDTFGIRSQDYFSAALLTLADMKGSNLLWLPPLLTDEHFRGKIVAQVKDEVALKPFWQQYEAMKESERRTQVETVLNKLRQLLFRPGLRNVLGQSKPKFDFADLFYERKIVLVPLNKSLIGAESARLLGSLIIGMTWTLALARADIPKEKRHIINVYIDELQDYLALPTDLADALAQARGLGVAITMAHQYRSQLTPQLKAGIDANARNKICFGLSGPDAKEMAAQASELTAQDFMNLPRYSVYANLQYHGRSTGWMMGKTLPPPPELRLPADLKAYSDQRYGVPAEETEAAYLKLLRANSHTDSDTQKPEPLIGRKPI